MNWFWLIVGDQVLEWNGISLTEKTFEEVQKLVSQTEGEVEIVVKR
jgi:protein piccolo